MQLPSEYMHNNITMLVLFSENIFHIKSQITKVVHKMIEMLAFLIKIKASLR